MAYLNALLVLLGTAIMLAGLFGLGGFGGSAAVGGFLALLVGIALIVLTRRVADLEDRQDDMEERRNERRALHRDRDGHGKQPKNLWRFWR